MSHPEDFCDDCGRRNIAWFVVNDAWNRVIRRGLDAASRPPDPMLCPSCFVLRAEAQGEPVSVWELRKAS